MGQSASFGQGSIGADQLKVTGDGSSGQVLVSDGDGTFTWTTDTENYLPLAGGTMSGAINLGSQNVTNGGTITGTFVGGITGNASTATALATARTIGGTSFDGTANIAVALAATATTLATTRAINGVNFNGSAAITVTADANTLSGTTLKSTVVSSSLTSVGTITTGVWNAGAVTSSGGISGTTGTFTGLVRIGTSPATHSTISTNAVFGASATGVAHPLAIANTATAATNNEARLSFVFDTGWSVTGYVGAKIENHSTAKTGLVFGTYDGSLSQKMVLDGSGNLGIGTTAPAHELTIDASAHPQIQLNDTTNTSNLRFYQTDAVASIFTGKSGAYATSLEFTTQTSAGATGVRLAIVGDKVGIGTSSPDVKLHINEDSGSSYLYLTSGGNNAAIMHMTANKNTSPNWCTISAGTNGDLMFGASGSGTNSDLIVKDDRSVSIANALVVGGTVTAGGAPVMSKTVWCGWQGSHNTTASSFESPTLNTHEIAVDTDYATISGTTITIVQAGWYLVKMAVLQHTDGGSRHIRIIIDGVNKSYTYHSGVTDWQSEVSDYSAYMATGTEIYFQCYITGSSPYAFHRIDTSMHSYATLVYLGK
jgi:hypothetical protein